MSPFPQLSTLYPIFSSTSYGPSELGPWEVHYSLGWPSLTRGKFTILCVDISEWAGRPKAAAFLWSDIRASWMCQYQFLCSSKPRGPTKELWVVLSKYPSLALRAPPLPCHTVGDRASWNTHNSSHRHLFYQPFSFPWKHFIFHYIAQL